MVTVQYLATFLELSNCLKGFLIAVDFFAWQKQGQRLDSSEQHQAFGLAYFWVVPAMYLWKPYSFHQSLHQDIRSGNFHLVYWRNVFFGKQQREGAKLKLRLYRQSLTGLLSSKNPLGFWPLELSLHAPHLAGRQWHQFPPSPITPFNMMSSQVSLVS